MIGLIWRYLPFIIVIAAATVLLALPIMAERARRRAQEVQREKMRFSSRDIGVISRAMCAADGADASRASDYRDKAVMFMAAMDAYETLHGKPHRIQHR